MSFMVVYNVFLYCSVEWNFGGLRKEAEAQEEPAASKQRKIHYKGKV